MVKVECSKCGEIIELAWRSVVSPFICGDCLDAQKFQEIASNAPSLQENASAIIADLEQQAANANALITDLSQQNATLSEDLNWHRERHEHWKYCWRKLNQENVALKSRGFWARVFNAESSI